MQKQSVREMEDVLANKPGSITEFIRIRVSVTVTALQNQCVHYADCDMIKIVLAKKLQRSRFGRNHWLYYALHFAHKWCHVPQKKKWKTTSSESGF